MLVLLVIWLFLGSARAALIPAVTVPVCVMAAFMPLCVFGFSINLLTLLALVLSHRPGGRRRDRGAGEHPAPRRPRRAGAAGGRCAARARSRFAVIATTAVLVAVFLPIGFMEGNTGRLFRELAVALAGAVAISASSR